MGNTKRIQILGEWFELVINKGKGLSNYDKNQNKVYIYCIDYKYIEEQIFKFYVGVFWEVVPEIIKSWKKKLQKANYNSFKFTASNNILIKLERKKIKGGTKDIQTTEKCECGEKYLIRTNHRTAQKFLACPKCQRTASIEINKKDLKGGYYLKINPEALCKLPIGKIECYIISNLISTYKVYNSVEYWKEVLSNKPDFIEIMEIKTMSEELIQAIEDLKNKV